jgi:hypothetical protein
MISNSKSLLSISIALTLTACGDSSVLITSSTGKAVDGYLSGSQVVCDTNNNGIKDTGEASTTTNATGDFTFSPSCASTLVVTGGTNMDTQLPFEGQLKAPAGSAVATPLTSLMANGGLSAAQVATALGLASGTDVTKTDPMSSTALLKKTLAVQQIIQQIANTMGNLAGTNNADAIQAIYSSVAQSVSATLGTSALIDNNGNIVSSVVTSIVKKSVEAVAASTDTSLATAKAGLATYNPTSISQLIGGPVAAQAQVLSNFSGNASELTAQTATMQTNAFISSAAKNLSTLLTTTVASTSNFNLTTVASSLTTLSTNTSDSTALSAFSTATATANTAASTALGSSFVAAVTTTPSSIANNTLSINGNQLTFSFDKEAAKTATLTAFNTDGIVLGSIPDSISFAYTLKGTPIPPAGSTVSVGLAITEASTGREVKVILDKVSMSVTGSTVTANVPANAKVYAYGKTSAGVLVFRTLTNSSANQLVAVSDSSLSFNVTNVLKTLMDKADSVSNYPFDNLLNVKGNFNVTMLVSNLAIASESSGAVKALTLAVPAAAGTAASMNGLGIVGKFTLQ